MIRKSVNNQAGMTLLEMLVAIVLSSILLCSMLPLFIQVVKITTTAQKISQQQLSIQVVMDGIQDEIRNARAVEVWVKKDNPSATQVMEVYHNPKRINAHSEYYLSAIHFEMPSGEERVMQLSSENDRYYLKYQNNVLSDYLSSIRVQEIDHQLILIFTHDELEIKGEYMMAIKPGYKYVMEKD